MAQDDEDDVLPRPRVYIYGRSPPPLDPEAVVPPAARGGLPEAPFDPNESFESRYHRRSGETDLGQTMQFGYPASKATGSEPTVAEWRQQKGMAFEPREGAVESRVAEKHVGGLTESDLLASKRPQFYWDPTEGINTATPLGRAAGTKTLDLQLLKQQGRPIIPWEQKRDARVGTDLSPQEEGDYQRWARSAHKSPKDEERDYDLKGYWKDVVHGNPDLPEYLKDSVQYYRDKLRTEGPKAHLPDMYKKPNHPTFSDKSLYHGFTSLGGVEPELGGHWDEEKKTFTPGITNQAHWNRAALQHYFDKYEKGYKVNFPDWYQ